MKPLLQAFIALWFTSSGALHASDYFVSPNGLDLNPGTNRDAGFATIGKGVSILQAGDTLTILPGEYHEAVNVKKLAGTKDAPITVRAQREGTVILRGDLEVTEWEPVPGLQGVFSAAIKDEAQGVADPRTMTHFSPAATKAELPAQPGAFLHDADSGRLLVRTLTQRWPTGSA